MKPSLTILTGDKAGEKVSLAEPKSYILGRDLGNEIPLPEKKISRKHAKLEWTGHKLLLEDLRSLNGTFVNGSLITEIYELKHKDRFQVGSYLFEVKLNAKKADEEAMSLEGMVDESPLRRTEPSLIAPEDFVEAHSTANGASISGKLSEVSLADLLQMLASTKKSGRLVIAAKKKEVEPHPPAGTPSLYIKGGDLVGAEINELQNEDAFYEILRWQNGFFALFPNVKFELKDTIELSLESLLLEGFRRLDEEKTASVQFSAETTFDVRLDEPLSSLEPDELRIFQLIWKKKRLSSVWESSHLDQKSTDTVIRKLFRAGYIKKH